MLALLFALGTIKIPVVFRLKRTHFRPIIGETNSQITIANIISGASTVKSYYTKNGKLPTTVTAGGTTFKMAEFLYLMCQATYNLYNKNTKAITVISGVAEPTSPFGDAISSKQLLKANYVQVAKNVADYIAANKRAPNYATCSFGKIIYSELGDAFSRVLVFYKNNDNTLPNYVVITTTSSGGQTKSGLNEKNTITNLAPYKKATAHCQVNDASIKSITATVTKGLTSDLAKAKAIFSYVRDHITYSYYSNSLRGAVKTLKDKVGNCCDHSNLFVAMCRNAGIPARYVHGTCVFNSGKTYGHVWAQVCIGDQWYVADATSSSNSIGTVKNWKTGSFTLHNKYIELPF